MMTEESEKYLCSPEKETGLMPTMRTVWIRLPEVFADQTAGNKLSAPRWLIMTVALCILLYTINIILTGKCESSFWPSVAGIVTSVMGGYAIGKWFKDRPGPPDRC